MKFFTLLTGASAIIAFTAMPAMADSAFDGPYVGAQIGLGKTSVDSESENGFNAGVFAGYGQALSDKFWLGGEVGYSTSGVDSSASVGGFTLTLEQEETLEIGVRPGYLINPETMIYSRLAYVRTGVKASLTDGITTVTASDNLDGFRFGGGVDHLVSDKVSLRVDGSYTNYNDAFDIDELLLRVGASYRF